MGRVIHGNPDPKPWKVDRVDREGNLLERVGEYTTEADALAHPRRLDGYYRTYRRGIGGTDVDLE